MASVGLYGDHATWPLPVATDAGGTTAPRARLLALLAGVWGQCAVAIDLALVAGAFLLAHWVRFIAPDAAAAALGLEQYAREGFVVGVLATALLAANGLYDWRRPRAWFSRTYLILSSVSTALVVTVALSFFSGDQRYSRLWFAAGWAFAVAGVALWRSAAQPLVAAMRDAVNAATRVLVVGANPLGYQIACELSARFQVVGYVDNGSDLPNLSPIGPIAQLEHVVREYGVDEIVVALPAVRREQVDRVIAAGFHRRVAVKLVPDLAGSAGTAGSLLPSRLEVHHIGGRPYLGFGSMARVTWAKRALDVLLVSVGVVVIAPLLAAIAVAIKLDSPGPVFYRQERVGKDGRRFWIVKFRSMCQDADRLRGQLRHQNEATGPLFKMRDDPRVTAVGRVLRRLSLDELPQLINVLKGEMSLVGPRPPIPAEVEEYEDWQLGRLRAVPGITGLWQVSGRSEVPFHDMVRLDLHYIRTWSLALDLQILWRTVPAVLTSRGAY